MKIRTPQLDPHLPSERLLRAINGSKHYWMLFKKLALYPTVETKSFSLLYDMAKSAPEGMLVGEIEVKVRATQSQTSNALNKLRSAGLILSEKNGTQKLNWIPQDVVDFLDQVVLSALGPRTDQVTLPSQRLLEAVKQTATHWTLFAALIKGRQHHLQAQIFTLLYNRFFDLPDDASMTVAQIVEALGKDEISIRSSIGALIEDGLLTQEIDKFLRVWVPVEVIEFLASYAALALGEEVELPISSSVWQDEFPELGPERPGVSTPRLTKF